MQNLSGEKVSTFRIYDYDAHNSILCNGDIRNSKLPTMMRLSCTSPCQNQDNLVLPFPVAKASTPYASTQIPNWGLF